MPDFVGKSNALTPDGLAGVAQRLSVKAQEIWAVVTVETSGCGFLPDRRPQILYERHFFHRLTQARFDDGDISDPSPGGYGPSGSHQYDRLKRAVQLDRTAALQSTSWGIGQIMGSNHAMVGFPDVETMVQAMMDSEDAQLSSVGAFLISSKLAGSLQSHDWTSFARGYNGPDFAKNTYDVRLRGEYQKCLAGVMPDLDVRATQLYLQFCGFSPGSVDGMIGPRTRAALSTFQKQQSLPVTGEVDSTVLTRLAQVAIAAATAATSSGN